MSTDTAIPPPLFPLPPTDFKMAEKNLVVNHRTLSYQGLFRVDELFRTIHNALDKLNYQKQEKKTEEKVFPSGKSTYLELRPFKEKTNYVTLMIKIMVHLDKVIEVTKKVNSLPRPFQQGKVTIIFDAWSITDYEHRWGMKPWFFFLKTAINKYIYRFPLEESFFGELRSDTDYLYQQINALLRLYKYQAPATATPEKTGEAKVEEAKEGEE